MKAQRHGERCVSSVGNEEAFRIKSQVGVSGTTPSWKAWVEVERLGLVLIRYTGWGKSRFTFVSTQNSLFLYYLFLKILFIYF